MPESTSILIVDDDRGGRDALEALLMTQGYSLVLASSGIEALQKIAERPLDLVLLDVMMPGIDGYEVCRRIRGNPAAADIPVLMLTALTDYRSRLAAFESGADDYITKPYDSMELFARVRTVTRLYRYRRMVTERLKFQQIFELSPNGQVLVDKNGMAQLWNGTLARLLNSPSTGELVGRPIQEWIAVERREAYLSVMEAFWKNPEQTQRMESRLVTRDEAVIPVDLVIGRIELGGQAMAHFTVIDIREKLQITGALQKERNMLHAILETSDDYLYCKDLASRFILANGAMAKFVGLQSGEELAGKTDFDFFPREHAMRYYSDEQTMLQAGKVISNAETIAMDAQGKEHVLLVTKGILKNRSGQVIGLVGVAKDITELKRLRTELAILKEQGGQPSPREVVAALDLPESQAVQQLIRLVGDFLVMQDGALTLARRPFSVKECLAKSAVLAGTDATSGRVVWKVKPSIPAQLTGDEDRISRAVASLVEAAAHYGQGVGLTVSAELEPAKSVNGSKPTLLHVIAVTAGGKTNQPAPVDLFDLAPRLESGGLKPHEIGLLVNKKLAEAAGGGLWAEPEGSGVRLHLTFPVQE